MKEREVSRFIPKLHKQRQREREREKEREIKS